MHNRLLRWRLGCWLAAVGTLNAVYIGVGRLQAHTAAFVLPETPADRLVPFNPAGSWLYMSFWLFIPLTFCCAPIRRVRSLCFGFIACSAAAGLVFLLFPTTLDFRPPPLPNNLHARLWLMLRAIDDWAAGSRNCLPSLHAALSVLCMWAMAGRRRWRVLWWAWGGLIVFSVMQVRQHLWPDVAAGVLLAGAAVRLLRRLEKGKAT